MTDDQLIQASRQGDENALRQLIKQYESRVASTVIGMLGNCPEAEDVGQERFIRFYNSLKNFRGDASVGIYLTRIAINLSLNELKRRKRKSLLFFRKLSDEVRQPQCITRMLENLIRPDESRYEAIKDILEKYSKRLYDQHENSFQEMDVVLDSLRAKLDQILTDTLKARLKQDMERMKSMRE